MQSWNRLAQTYNNRISRRRRLSQRQIGQMQTNLAWKGSRTGRPHTALSGFIGGGDEGQYLTNRACPYPCDFCTYVAKFIAEPKVSFTRRITLGAHSTDDEGKSLPAMVVGPQVSTNIPPADHYITHLPKHPGCKACMNCNVQRGHCRDPEKTRKLTKPMPTQCLNHVGTKEPKSHGRKCFKTRWSKTCVPI